MTLSVRQSQQNSVFERVCSIRMYTVLRCLFIVSVSLGAMRASAEEYAITMDDPSTTETPVLSSSVRNQRILSTLRRHNHRATLFVCGKRIDSPQGRALLQSWWNAHHLLGNHTYSHFNYSSATCTASEFEDDILKVEAMLQPYHVSSRLFRFPYLKAGETVAKRDQIRAFLKKRGFRNGYVTIDTSDWYIDQRLIEALKQDPSRDLDGFRRFYVEHVSERASYYSELAMKLHKRPVKHTLLLHHNLLSALFLNDLIESLRTQGWRLTDSSIVFEDPIYQDEPDVLPAGESLLWAQAKAAGVEGMRYPGEDGSYEEPKMKARGL